MSNSNDNINGAGLQVYELHPPAWLPKAHSSTDLGYLGFFPPHIGQEEDLLSETNIKNGYVLDDQVSAETFSAHSIVQGELSSSSTYSKLEALMNEIFIRRAGNLPPIPPSTFRIPTRVTLNDSKRRSWFADLANPEVPLYKLGKSVPHGAKGHDLLDLLQSNNVAIPRAVWFLRVFGANETAGLRNKPAYNPTQYSTDWANVVTSYMKKQLNDIALPSAPRPGLNIKQTFKGVLSDADTRERWISRFVYCLKLLQTFYSEGLVDNRTFLVWVVQQMSMCNLAQTGFITRLADEYLDGIIDSRPLTRPFIDACLSKLSEIRSSSAHEFLCDTEILLISLLQRLCLVVPDSFVSPKMWKAHAHLLTDVLSEDVIKHHGYVHVERNARDICQILQENLADIRRRNEAMLFRNIPMHMSTRLSSTISGVKLLNTISSSTNLESLPFFTYTVDDEPAFIEKLDMLLTWCVTPLQYGDHRPFAAVTLIQRWRLQVGDRANRRDFSPPDEFLQDRLFDWLDSSDVAGDLGNIHPVSLLFEGLVKHELFSYASYIQRLIARGEPGLSSNEILESRHRKFLQWIPLCKSTSSLISQRKVTLYGIRARETPEEVTEREMRREIRAVLPGVFGVQSHSSTMTTSTLLGSCTVLMNSSRFEQVRTFKHWLLPILEKQIASQASEAKPTLLKTYSVSTELMSHAKCFHCILDLTLCLLEHSTTIDLLNAVIDTLQRFATIWACMNVMKNIISALDGAHQVWRTRGVQSRPLLSLLLEFDGGRYLSSTSRDQITNEITVFTSALQPATNHPDATPEVLPEILLLAGDPDVDAPSLLANSLWIKYRKSIDWAWKVWDNTVASLRQVPLMTPDEAGRRACALRYGIFLWHVDQHLATGLDRDVLQWFSGTGKNELTALTIEAWDVLTVVLLYLTVHGALKTTTILSGLVYPAWQQAAGYTAVHQGPVIETLLQSANNICRRLLLSEDINDSLPPTDLLDLQRIRTRRQDVYGGSHFPLLASSVPLLICVENNDLISGDLRNESTSLRHTISHNNDFRQGAYKNLDAVRKAFETSLQRLDGPNQTLSNHIIAGLRMLLSDISDDLELSDWPTVPSLLSPWKIAATMVQMQLILKRMGQELVHDPANQTANINLDQLILMLFHHSMTADEAFFVGDMARFVDSVVAGKFINNGLRCVGEIAQKSISDTCDPGDFHQVGEVLRILIYAAEPLRDRTTPPYVLENIVQEDFLEASVSKLVLTEAIITAGSLPEATEIRITEDVILVLRLIQFELGFRNQWNARIRTATEKMASVLFRLAKFYGLPANHHPTLCPLIIDTLYYIYDEMPNDIKATPYDPFRNYPDEHASDLPPDLPAELRRQLASFLPSLPVAASVYNMINSYRDSAGNLIHGPSVINRPWEWIENLGEPAHVDHKAENKGQEEMQQLENRHHVKNTGSLSLDLFGTQLTGDSVLRGEQDMDSRMDSRMGRNIRGFEDGLSAENIFRRDWRETRVEMEVDAITGVAGGRSKGEPDHDGGMTFNLCSKAEKRASSRDSPTPSIVSRSSARGSGGSLRHSPQGSIGRSSNSTISDIIEIESNSMAPKRLGAKRKASAVITVSDDEVEIIEGPMPAPLGTKKSKPRTQLKAKAKR